MGVRTGAGLAKAFGLRYPRVHDNWQRFVSKLDGKTLATPHMFESQIWYYDKSLLFFPTKIHWKDSSKIEYIQTNLDWFSQKCLDKDEAFKHSSYAFPALGCGLGGLSERDVLPLMVDTFIKLNQALNISFTIVLHKP